jgi:hypothetical protein
VHAIVQGPYRSLSAVVPALRSDHQRIVCGPGGFASGKLIPRESPRCPEVPASDVRKLVDGKPAFFIKTRNFGPSTFWKSASPWYIDHALHRERLVPL